jgi:hypothetical protein
MIPAIARSSFCRVVMPPFPPDANSDHLRSLFMIVPSEDMSCGLPADSARLAISLILVSLRSCKTGEDCRSLSSISGRPYSNYSVW